MSRRLVAWWWTGLTAVLAGAYVVIAVISPLPTIRWPALAGAVVVLAGLWSAPRSQPIALVAVVVGALLPAVTVWWSLVVPLTAVLIIVCGALAVRGVQGRIPRQEGVSP